MPSAPPARQSLSVAVVGAGAAGLAAARELLLEGHRVVVYEQSEGVGGVWRYQEQTEDDPLGRAPARRVHGSMYAGLRTNLPREVMGFAAFPFDHRFPGSADPDRFCSHSEVQRYLAAFAAHYGLLRHVRFGTEVAGVAPLPPAAPPADPSQPSSERWWRWRLEARRAGDPGATSSRAEEYDAVVVCNGHYSRPRVPEFPGQDVFPGRQMHSHNYRRPGPFRGQTVVLVGAAFSGSDIAQELLGAGAARVVLSARAWEDPATGDAPDEGALSGEKAAGAALRKAPNVRSLGADGSVAFEDGSVAENVDTVMYCTGYLYSFPFLEGAAAAAEAEGDAPAPEAPPSAACSAISVQDNRVGPVHRHVFPPHYAPTLSFVGLTWKVVPFPQFELQARWIARCLSGRARLPGEAAMAREVGEYYGWMEAEGLPVRYTHRQQGDLQRRYNEWLTAVCGPGERLGLRRGPGLACGEGLSVC